MWWDIFKMIFEIVIAVVCIFFAPEADVAMGPMIAGDIGKAASTLGKVAKTIAKSMKKIGKWKKVFKKVKWGKVQTDATGALNNFKGLITKPNITPA